MPILRFKNWLGGIADDQESPNPNSAALIQGFNIHERPPYLVSNNVLTKFSNQTTFASPVLGIFKEPVINNSHVYLIRQDGVVMKQTNGAGTFSNYDLGVGALSRSISGVDVYNSNNATTTSFLIWCDNGGELTAMDFNTPTRVQLRSSGTEGPVFWFRKAGKVYCGNGNTLDSVSGDTPTKEAAVLTLQKDDHIYRLDQFQNYLAIFTLGRGVNKRYLYLWDTFSDGVNAVYEIPETLNTAVGFASIYLDGVLYFLTGQPVSLYMFDGTSVKKIWKYPRYLSQVFRDTSIDIFPNAISGFEGRLFFGLGNAISGNANSKVGLWSYGRRDIKYPNAISLEVLNNGAITQDVGITALKDISGNLYGGEYNGTTYEIAYYQPIGSNINKENGVLESLWISPADLGIGEPGDQFQITRVGLMTDQLAASESITVKIKYDYDTTAYSSVTASLTHNTASDYFMATDISGQLFRKFQYRIDTTAATTNAPDISEVYFDVQRRPTFGSA